jgi:hypothetical protein
MTGISFIEPLFHGVVSGKKTQTRRIMKPMPDGVIIKKYTPRYRKGEVLYLKEPYVIDLAQKRVTYKYGNNSGEAWQMPKWGNKLFMPEKFARYFIEITDVRAELLQDISDEDCIREGIELYDG